LNDQSVPFDDPELIADLTRFGVTIREPGELRFAPPPG
jgi:hypothetical protein